MSITCDKCKKTFKSNYLLTRHINRAKPCIEVQVDEEVDELLKQKHSIEVKINKGKNKDIKSKICLYCKKTFSTHGNMTAHQNKNCRTMKDLQKTRLDIINSLEKIRESRLNAEKNTEDNGKVTNINITQNITNITNNNNITINVDFGKETIEHLSITDIINIVNKRFGAICFYVEKVHFNKDKPDYINVYIPKISQPYAKIFKNNKWVLCDSDEVIDKIKDSKMILLDKKISELRKKELISEEIQDKFISFHDDFSDMDKDVEKNVNKKIKLLLYNNREMVNDNKKL